MTVLGTPPHAHTGQTTPAAVTTGNAVSWERTLIGVDPKLCTCDEKRQTTPWLLAMNRLPAAIMRDFMTTQSPVPICVDVEPVFDPNYGVEPIPTLVPGLIATLFFVNKE